MKKLSCITAVLNACGGSSHGQLETCIRSIAALACEHEHLFYDGGSKDGTLEVIRNVAKADPSIALVAEPDKGIYAALNKGVRDAQGEWFYVLGADDRIIDPKALDEILGTTPDDTDVIVTPVETDRRGGRGLKGIESHLLFCSTPYCHQGVLVRTSVMREMGGYDERYRIASDCDLFLRLHLAGKRFRFVDRVFARYSQGGLSDRLPQVMHDDFAGLIQRNLDLRERSLAFYRRRGYPPFPSVAKYLFHPDASIRKSARHVWTLWSAYCRACLYDHTIMRAKRWMNRLFGRRGMSHG